MLQHVTNTMTSPSLSTQPQHSPVVSGLQVGGAHRLGHVARRAKIDDFDSVRLSQRVHQHDVLRLQVGVDQAQALQLHQRRGHLLQNGPDALEQQRAELAVLQEVVKVLLQHLEHKARVVLVLETLVRADKIELIGVLRAQPAEDAHLQAGDRED